LSDITIKVTDRLGTDHELLAPTDMNMNLMELCKSYELPDKKTHVWDVKYTLPLI